MLYQLASREGYKAVKPVKAVAERYFIKVVGDENKIGDTDKEKQ
jgi:hypothetical protein